MRSINGSQAAEGGKDNEAVSCYWRLNYDSTLRCCTHRQYKYSVHMGIFVSLCSFYQLYLDLVLVLRSKVWVIFNNCLRGPLWAIMDEAKAGRVGKQPAWYEPNAWCLVGSYGGGGGWTDLVNQNKQWGWTRSFLAKASVCEVFNSHRKSSLFASRGSVITWNSRGH